MRHLSPRRHAVPTLVLMCTSACGPSAPTAPSPLSCPTSTCTYFFSFERDMEGWTGRAADAGPWHVDRSTKRARDGLWSAELYANNTTDFTKLWLERHVRAHAGELYNVRIDYALCCVSYAVDSPRLFHLIADARSEAPPGIGHTFASFPPETHDDSSADSGVGDTLWRHKRFDLVARASPHGDLYVSLGVWLAFEVPFTFYVDNVRLTLTQQD